MIARLHSGARHALIVCPLVISALGAPASKTVAQGPTTAAIGGRILDGNGIGVSGVDVVVKNEATGIAMRATSRGEGRFLLSGLEIGGPYSVIVRRIGSPA